MIRGPTVGPGKAIMLSGYHYDDNRTPRKPHPLRVALTTLALVLAAGLLTIVLSACMGRPDHNVTVIPPVLSTDTFLPCQHEDSVNCYWDADTMGNGTGRSFSV